MALKKNGVDPMIAAREAVTKAFSAWTESDRAFVLQAGKVRTIKKGELLCQQGDASESFFLVMHTPIRIEIHLVSQGGIPLQSLQQGEIAGWSWLFAPHVWNFDVRALESGTVLEVSASVLNRQMREQPVFANKVLHFFGEILSRRLMQTRMQLLDLYSHPEQVGKKAQAQFYG